MREQKHSWAVEGFILLGEKPQHAKTNVDLRLTRKSKENISHPWPYVPKLTKSFVVCLKISKFFQDNWTNHSLSVGGCVSGMICDAKNRGLKF